MINDDDAVRDHVGSLMDSQVGFNFDSERLVQTETESVKDIDEVIDVKWEGLDYVEIENTIFLEEDESHGLDLYLRKEFLKWVFCAVIGMVTGMVAACLNISIEAVAEWKFHYLRETIQRCISDSCMTTPLLFWTGFGAFAVLLSAVLTVFVAPSASSSGIPQLKAYLNGMHIPRFLSLPTLCVKVVGVWLAVCSGLAVGQEGPMVHSGAIIAAGIPLLNLSKLRCGSKCNCGPCQWIKSAFELFRSDHDKRDFVQAGVAAGIAAAFGTPLTGVLFSLEEGASFWNHKLTLRMLLCSMTSTYTLNVLMSLYSFDTPTFLNNPGLFTFGTFDSNDLSNNFSVFEIPLVLVVGLIGGALGALFNRCSVALAKFRFVYVWRGWLQVVECVVVCVVTCGASFAFSFFTQDCCPEDAVQLKQHKRSVQYFCEAGDVNAVSMLVFQLPEQSIWSLFHTDATSISWSTLLVFSLFYFALTCWSCGVVVPSGIFIPNFLVGAAWGRLFGLGLQALCPVLGFRADLLSPGKYALFGAASQMAGVVRMTISITCMFAEATGNVTLGLPIMLVCVTAKFVGDMFSEGLYELLIHVQGFPFLDFEPPPGLSRLSARDVGHSPVYSLRATEQVSRIVELLRSTTHQAFPIVDEKMLQDIAPHFRPDTFGRVIGLILRQQLLLILKKRLYLRADTAAIAREATHDFRRYYPLRLDLDSIELPSAQHWVDLRPFMNPSPYSVHETVSLPKVFRLFRGLGLRHVLVVNHHNQIVAMVTRKDLASFRTSTHGATGTITRLPLVTTTQ